VSPRPSATRRLYCGGSASRSPVRPGRGTGGAAGHGRQWPGGGCTSRSDYRQSLPRKGRGHDKREVLMAETRKEEKDEGGSERHRRGTMEQSAPDTASLAVQTGRYRSAGSTEMRGSRTGSPKRRESPASGPADAAGLYMLAGLPVRVLMAAAAVNLWLPGGRQRADPGRLGLRHGIVPPPMMASAAAVRGHAATGAGHPVRSAALARSGLGFSPRPGRGRSCTVRRGWARGAPPRRRRQSARQAIGGPRVTQGTAEHHGRAARVGGGVSAFSGLPKTYYAASSCRGGPWFRNRAPRRPAASGARHQAVRGRPGPRESSTAPCQMIGTRTWPSRLRAGE